MKPLKILVLALCLVLWSLQYSNAQELLSTGNLVNFTGTPTDTTSNWNNGVYVGGLTCWQPGGPGNCGPYPNVQTNGSINFSYGQVNLNQVVNINNALAAAGSGVQLYGFHFGFTAKNGNGWDNGQQDYLAAYVSVYDKAGKSVVNYDYSSYTNRKYDWSNFNFNETFNKPYDISKLSTVQYGFIGRDTNGWAGPYGPEINNVSFSLNYRIDPCVANPASSPSCPGFSNLVKTPTLSITSTSVATLIPESTTSGTPIVNVGGVQLSNTGTISAPDNIPQVLKDVQATTQQSQSMVSSNNSQQTSKSTPNMSLIMSVIGQIQANDKATQAAAVQNANQVAAASAAKAQEQANQTVESLNTMSQTSSQSANTQMNNNIQSINLTNQSVGQYSISMNQLSNIASLSISSTPSYLSGSQINLPTVSNYSLASNISNNQYTLPQVETQSKFENKQQEIDVPVVSVNTNSSRSTGVNDFFANRLNLESAKLEQSTDTVNKNVTPNDLAGGVDIASIATTPKGYEAYSFVLKDSAFYKVEAIYKDQKTVDNARALRSLSSDRLHQEMVDQQYKGR